MKTPLAWSLITNLVYFAVRVLANEHPSTASRSQTNELSRLLADPQRLGTLLWDETVRAVASLYGQDAAATHIRHFGRYEYIEPTTNPPDPRLVRLLCASLEALSWEAPDYYAGSAYRVLRDLADRADRCAPPVPTRSITISYRHR